MSLMKNSVSISLKDYRRQQSVTESSVDTIAALATAPGTGAVGIIRISGPASLQILANLCPKLETIHIRKMHLADLCDREGEVLDDVLLCFFEGPRSFTGEDSLEIYCHGSPYIAKKILEELCGLGCRLADPGEFTRRAFLNGKLDLTAAEGIKQLVDAHSSHQWQAARYLASGQLARYVDELRQTLIRAMAYLEARIDFPEEGDIKDISLDPALKMVAEVECKIDQLKNSYKNGKVASEGLRVAIVGKPNMGKSSLLNCMLGEDRAIVTEIAGTTRDYIEESCLISGRLIRFIDTAGIRETSDIVEQKGVDAARELASASDLILALSIDGDSASLPLEVDEKRTIRVVNKIDLSPIKLQDGSIGISCLTGEGLDELREKIVGYAEGYLSAARGNPVLTSLRQFNAIIQAQEGLARFNEAKVEGAFDEMLAFELLAVARSLEEIIGSVENDDVLDKIFSEFCVGK